MLEGPFIARVKELGRFAGRAEAMRAIRATVMALGEMLRDDERAAFGRELPPATNAALGRVAYVGDLDRDGFYARVAHHERVSLGFAVEHAQIVCRALAGALPEGRLVHLRKELGPSIASLLEEPEPVETLPRWTSAAGSTLASGREGSRHPVSEARLDRAQSAGRPGPRRTIAETKE